MAEALRIRYLFVTIVFFPLFVWGFAVADYTMNNPITKIVYYFRDASVPPQYHRSYKITVTRVGCPEPASVVQRRMK